MAAKHKYQDSNISISSTLARARLIEVAKQAIDEMKYFDVTGIGDEGFVTQIRSWAKIPLMTFVVHVEDHGDSRELTTGIDEFTVAQDKLWYFIPVGPKTLVAYKEYKRYMELLERAIKTLDPSAHAVLTERVEV